MVDKWDGDQKRQDIDWIEARKSCDEKSPELRAIKMHVGVRIGQYESRQDEEERYAKPPVVQNVLDDGWRDAGIRSETGA